MPLCPKFCAFFKFFMRSPVKAEASLLAQNPAGTTPLLNMPLFSLSFSFPSTISFFLCASVTAKSSNCLSQPTPRTKCFRSIFRRDGFRGWQLLILVVLLLVLLVLLLLLLLLLLVLLFLFLVPLLFFILFFNWRPSASPFVPLFWFCALLDSLPCASPSFLLVLFFFFLLLPSILCFVIFSCPSFLSFAEPLLLLPFLSSRHAALPPPHSSSPWPSMAAPGACPPPSFAAVIQRCAQPKSSSTSHDWTTPFHLFDPSCQGHLLRTLVLSRALAQNPRQPHLCQGPLFTTPYRPSYDGGP